MMWIHCFMLFVSNFSVMNDDLGEPPDILQVAQGGTLISTCRRYIYWSTRQRVGAQPYEAGFICIWSASRRRARTQKLGRLFQSESSQDRPRAGEFATQMSRKLGGLFNGSASELACAEARNGRGKNDFLSVLLSLINDAVFGACCRVSTSVSTLEMACADYVCGVWTCLYGLRSSM